MATSAQQIGKFLEALDKLTNDKYIVADARIEEALRAIADCRALTDLFSAVTERFDYPAAKKTYLRFPASNTSSHGIAYLPKDRREVLAFVFCLLADIDAGRIKFDDFLLRYFYEDGSYTASFALFTERMLRPFCEIVKDCFPDISANVRAETAAEKASKKNASLDAFTALVIEERARLKGEALSSVDAAAGDAILSETIRAAGKNDVALVKVLVASYRYFLRSLFLTGGEELIRAGRNLE